MIKFIVSDVDGTLVKDASPEMYPEMIEMIKKLTAAGVVVCIASGRQSSSLEKLFAEVKNDLIFVCDNGAHIKCRGKDLRVAKMNTDYVESIVKELRTFDNCRMICEGPGVTYVESDDQKFIEFLRDQYRVDFVQVKDVLTEGKDIIKVSAFNRPSIRDLGEGKLIPEWGDKVKATMAGEDWVDFMDKSVDKGHSIQFIQEFFGFKPEETIVFGDNNNDIGMLERAVESYAVETAPDAVKAHAKHICPPWSEKGVYQVLSELFE